jgi:hypothetical protein
MPTLNIPESTYKRLAAKAAALNISVEEMVAPALDQLAGSEHPNDTPPSPSLDEKKRAFEALTKLVQSQAHRYPTGHVVDCDRESVYLEREDAQR